MKRSISSFLLLTCFISYTLAQTASLKGTVYFAKEKSPIKGATIVLTKQGQKKNIVKSGSTNDDGTFNLLQISAGSYDVVISLVGYHSYKKTLQLTDKQLNIGKIYLEEKINSFKEVEIVAMGPQMKVDIDKKVFTVDKSLVSTGVSVTEMLKSIPSVSVDDNGSISLRNNPSVVVWINGKPSGLNADNRSDILEQMPAESVEKVEVITNPSAKYDSEGSAGIINLVLKKDRKPGLNGSITGGGVFPYRGKAGYNAGLNLNLNVGKWDVYANIGMRDRKTSTTGWTNRVKFNTFGDTILNRHITKDNLKYLHGPFFRSGFTYHIDKRTSIGLDGYLMLGSSNNSGNSHYFGLDYWKDTTLFTRNTVSKGDRHIYNLDLNFSHDFDKEDTRLVSVLSFSNNPNSSTTDFSQITDPNSPQLNPSSPSYDPSSIIPTIKKQTSNGWKKRLEFKTDYTNKLSENSRMEAGVDFYLNNHNTDNTTTVNNSYSLANKFDFYQTNYAGYATYTNKWGKFGTLLGLRGEYTYMWFYSNNQKYTRQYFRPFPSVFLNYSFDSNNQLQLNYTRRINRPSVSDMNPFYNNLDANNVNFGNPNLNPEYANSVELNYLKTWTKHTLSASIYYKQTRNNIQTYTWVTKGGEDGEDTLKTSKANGGLKEHAGFEIVQKDNFFDCLDLTTTLNVYYAYWHKSTFVSDDEITDVPSVHNVSWTIKSIANLMLPKNFSLQLTGDYKSPKLLSQGKNYGHYLFEAGLRKSLLKNKLKVTLSVKDIFNSRSKKVDDWGANFAQSSETFNNGRTFAVNVSYYFGSKLKKNKLKEKEQPDDLEEESSDDE